MERTTLTILWLLISICSLRIQAADQIRWAPDLNSARAAAQQFQVPLMVHFFGDHCLPCELVNARVFKDPQVITTLNRFFICVQINASAEENQAVVTEFQVQSWPTDVFFAPDGKMLYQGISPTTATSYMTVLKNVALLNRNRLVMLAGQPTTSTNQHLAAAVQAPSAASPTIYAQSNLAPQGAPNASPPVSGTPSTYPSNSLASNSTQSASAVASGQPASTAPLVTVSTSVDGQPHPQTFPASSSTPQIASTANSRGSYQTPATFTTTQQSVSPSSGSERLQPRVQPGDIRSVEPQRMALPVVASPPQETPSTGLASNQRWSTTNSDSSKQQRVPAVLISNPYGETSSDTSASPDASGASDTPRPGQSEAQQSTEPALGGYCPVTLSQQAQWVEGQPQFAVRHRGKTYFMASAEKMNEFLAAPDASSPVLSGYDPLIYLERGELVPGKLHFGLHEDSSGRFMLFSTQENKDKYWSNFDGYQQQLSELLRAVGIQQP